MQVERQIRMQDGAQGQNDKVKPKKSKKRHGGRVVLSLDVEGHVREALRERAAAAGVSMAEYLSNALAQPGRAYSTAAVEVAQPLTRVSYFIARIGDALGRGDAPAALEALRAANEVVAAALHLLQHKHAREYRSDERRRAGGWSG